jgi:hypothetical protein
VSETRDTTPPDADPLSTVEARVRAALAEARRKHAAGDRSGARDIVMAVLAVDDRQREARQILAALDRPPQESAPSKPPGPRSTTTKLSTAKPSSRSPWPAIAGVGIGVLALSVAGVVYQRSTSKRAVAPVTPPAVPAANGSPAADPDTGVASPLPPPSGPNLAADPPPASLPAITTAPAAAPIDPGLIRRIDTLQGAGDYAGALRLVDEALRARPGDPPLRDLQARLQARAQRVVDEAGPALREARAAAEGVRASELARDVFARATALQAEADRLYRNQSWGEALTRRLEATRAYGEARDQARVDQARLAYEDARARAVAAGADRLAAERFNEAAARASRAASLRNDRRFDAASQDYEWAAATMDLAQTASVEAGLRERRVSVSPSPPSARSVEVERAAIQAVLGRYMAAMEAKDLAALKAIWPGLGGVQEERVRSSFRAVRQLKVQLDVTSAQIDGAAATLICRRRDVVTTPEGTTLQSDRQAVVKLAKKEAWSIVSIQ